MDEKTFLEEVAEILELDDASTLTMESDFRKAADYWSSLVGFSLLIYLQDTCGANITAEQFTELNTIGELWAVANGEEK